MWDRYIRRIINTGQVEELARKKVRSCKTCTGHVVTYAAETKGLIRTAKMKILGAVQEATLFDQQC